MNGNDVKHVRVTVLQWSQARLASELGMSSTSVYRMETGRQKIEKVTELAIRWLAWKESMIECDFSSPAVLPVESINSSIHDVCDKLGKVEDKTIHDVYCSPGELASKSLFSNEELIATLSILSSDFSDMTHDSMFDAVERFYQLYYSLDGVALDRFIEDFYIKQSPIVWLNRRSLVEAWRQFSGDQDFHL